MVVREAGLDPHPEEVATTSEAAGRPLVLVKRRRVMKLLARASAVSHATALLAADS